MSALKSNHGEWLKISINTHPISHESLSAFLFDLGCTGIVTEDFQDHSLTAYLPLPDDLEEVRANISSYLKNLEKIFPEVQTAQFELNTVRDNGWNRNWRGFFTSESITENLIIIPAWESRLPETNGIVIKIDPGPAFGTGQHPTTQMCLRMIEKLSKPEQWTMLDVGTGSGILSIYAARLNASNILAIDIDPEAVRWAQRNIELNDLAGRIELSAKTPDKISGSFSLVVANLFFEEIIKLFPLFQGFLGPGGWLVLSGILRDQEKELRELLHKCHFYDYEVLYKEEWACLASKRVR